MSMYVRLYHKDNGEAAFSVHPTIKDATRAARFGGGGVVVEALPTALN